MSTGVTPGNFKTKDEKRCQTKGTIYIQICTTPVFKHITLVFSEISLF
jgi:hypothetical protein